MPNPFRRLLIITFRREDFRMKILYVSTTIHKTHVRAKPFSSLSCNDHRGRRRTIWNPTCEPLLARVEITGKHLVPDVQFENNDVRVLSKTNSFLFPPKRRTWTTFEFFQTNSNDFRVVFTFICPFYSSYPTILHDHSHYLYYNL